MDNFSYEANKIIVMQQKMLFTLLKISRRNSKRRKLRLKRRMYEEFLKQKQLLTHNYLSSAFHSKETFLKKERSKDWWTRVVPNCDENYFIQNFRMSRRTYEKICNELNAVLKPSEKAIREPIPVPKIVAVAIYKLASGADNRVVANRFGIHRCTARKCLIRFLNATKEVLLKKYITFPTAEECREISQNFKETSNIPNIIGAIGGCHIPIAAPKEAYSDFLNRKGWTSVVLQSIVDCNYRFRDIVCKHPGNQHDATILKDSGFYQKVNEIMPMETIKIGGNNVPYCIVGDPAYPLENWLLKNYPYGCNKEQESFNAHANKARIVVEHAYDRLKGRWRILSKKIEMHFSLVPFVVAASCVLHNIVEYANDPFDISWINEVHEIERNCPQPAQRELSESNSDGQVRDIICKYLSKNFTLLEQN